MKLAHPLLSRPIKFQENRIPVLVLENPVAFRQFATELVHQSEGADGNFILSHQDTPLDCATHLHVMQDFIHTGEVEKRLQTRALSALLRRAQETLAQESHQLSQAVQEFLGKVALLAEYPVDYDQSENLSALLKAMDFHIDLDGLSPCEALHEQLSLMHRLAQNQCFVLINARTYFSPQELTQLYQMASYQKMHLLLLESHAPTPILPWEETTLFDADLCELHLDFPEDLH